MLTPGFGRESSHCHFVDLQEADLAVVSEVALHRVSSKFEDRLYAASASGSGGSLGGTTVSRDGLSSSHSVRQSYREVGTSRGHKPQPSWPRASLSGADLSSFCVTACMMVRANHTTSVSGSAACLAVILSHLCLYACGLRNLLQQIGPGRFFNILCRSQSA